ncbi:MAG: hypothetical protein HPKKFMNG_03155 [Planctomycetes bacterium]|nr:hypothetical protein [Planctomycetota bacterium]
MPTVECVPNFSEGRRQEVVDAIADCARQTPGVRLLGAERDADHNRCVITFAGEPDAVVEAAVSCARRAMELIDLRQHQGEHPRMGAADVIPFVPIEGIDMAGCVELARRCARRIGDELEIPVYLYGEAASREERKILSNVREGEFEGLREKIGVDSAKDPDFGPRRIHPTAGATAVGARFFLIAYNVNLQSQDLKLAKRIAKAIREKDGGMPAVRALGLELKDKGCVQVSMNLVDYRQTSPAQAYARIAELAAAEGVEIRESEIIGLVPQEALELCARQTMEMKKLRGPDNASQVWLNQFAMETLKLQEFAPQEQIIELKLSDFSPEPPARFSYLKEVGSFLDDLASAAPTPGGGAAAAVLGATGCALGEMVANLTVGKKKYAEVQVQVKADLKALEDLRPRVLQLFIEDAQAFDAFGKAGAMPKETDIQKAERKLAMQAALKGATESPEKTARLCLEALKHVAAIARIGNKHAISDCGVGALSLFAGINAAVLNMRINLPGIDDGDFKARFGKLADTYESEAKALLESTLAVVRAAIGN